MAKKVLYLGNGKWCWTEACRQHSAVIAAKHNYLDASESGSTAKLAKATQELMSTPEGLATYRYLKVQELTKQLGRKPTLGLDLDGTTGDFTDALRTYMGTGAKIPQSEWLSHFPEPDEYAMWKGKNAWYKSQEDFKTQFQAAEQAGIYRTLKIFDNAVNTLKELRAYGFRIKVLTARNALFNPDSRSWIIAGEVPVKTILNPGNNKHTVRNVDVYMDDSPHVINLLLENQKKVVVMKQNYNLHNIPEHENARRVDNWTGPVIESIFDLLDSRKKK